MDKSDPIHTSFQQIWVGSSLPLLLQPVRGGTSGNVAVGIGLRCNVEEPFPNGPGEGCTPGGITAGWSTRSCRAVMPSMELLHAASNANFGTKRIRGSIRLGVSLQMANANPP